MDHYSQKRTQDDDSGNGIPSPPTECHCGAPVDVLRLVVFQGGQRKIGAFSGFGYRTPQGGLLLRDQYDYGQWWGVCARCYDKADPVNSVTSFTQNEIRHSWMWFIAKMTEGTKLAMFQGRPATPEQEERFLFVVNSEAKRLNQPEAIPKQYRIREVWAK